MKIVSRIVRFVNRVAVSAVKSLGVVSFIATLVIIAVLAGALIVDRQLAGGYYSGYLITSRMNVPNWWFWEFSYLTETYPLWSTIAVVIGFVLLILLKLWLRKGLVRAHSDNIATNLAYVVLSTALNLVLIAASLALVLNGMLISYLHTATYTGDEAQAGFWERAAFLTEQVNANRDLSSIALQKIIYDLNRDPEGAEPLSDEEHRALCLEVNHLIDLQGGPRTALEHYLRNLLNRAPDTLDDMVATIEAAQGPSWRLLPPSQSAYHMQGPDGEYNLKFVSADGFFEAVYDKSGALLTQDNDPVNMGTYNYVDPVSQQRKHTTYDVLPYYQWGNTPQMGAVSRREMERVLGGLERFSQNREAEARYERYRRMVMAAGGG